MICVVCDSGPLTHLWQIDVWAAFSAFETIHIPEQVAKEVEQHVDLKQLCQRATCTVDIHSVSPLEIADMNCFVGNPDLTLHTADIAVLVLSYTLQPELTLTDDLPLRRVLEERGHTPMGSVGLLLYAYKHSLLTRSQLHQAVERLFVHSTLYLSPQFKTYVYKLLEANLIKD